MPFLDANVELRHLLNDHADHSPRASAFIARIERGEVRVRVTELVVFKVVFTLERTFRQPKALIRAGLVALLLLPGIVIPGKRRLLRAFELYVDHNLPFGDAYQAALMEQLGVGEIVSFDRHFDRVPGILRTEP